MIEFRLIRKFKIEALQLRLDYLASELKRWPGQKFNELLCSYEDTQKEIEIQRSYMELEA